MNKLPVLISIPHGGHVIPESIKDNVMLSSLELLDDSDAFTKNIYDIGNHAEYVIKTDIARAIIDLNRSQDQYPPEYPDGVIKSHTCYDKQIYKKGMEPDIKKKKQMIQSYYLPYHNNIKRALAEKKAALALDCHSMAAIGPSSSKDKGKKRPLMCLGNVWGQTCTELLMNRISDCFCCSFGFKASDIQMNQPFAGGYITQTYGKSSIIPWIQVEISRALYLDPQYFDRQALQMKDKMRLNEINQMFQTGLYLFFNNFYKAA
jgi:formiminoglutamase